MNFLIFASPLGRAKIMRIHTHEWKLITLIFENEWYYDVIPRYKENKQQTTTNKQTIQTTTISRMSQYSRIHIIIIILVTTAIEEQKLTL